jgi:hypothetical protein
LDISAVMPLCARCKERAVAEGGDEPESRHGAALN